MIYKIHNLLSLFRYWIFLTISYFASRELLINALWWCHWQRKHSEFLLDVWYVTVVEVLRIQYVYGQILTGGGVMICGGGELQNSRIMVDSSVRIVFTLDTFLTTVSDNESKQSYNDFEGIFSIMSVSIISNNKKPIKAKRILSSWNLF